MLHPELPEALNVVLPVDLVLVALVGHHRDWQTCEREADRTDEHAFFRVFSGLSENVAVPARHRSHSQKGRQTQTTNQRHVKGGFTFV